MRGYREVYEGDERKRELKRKVLNDRMKKIQREEIKLRECIEECERAAEREGNEVKI